MKTILLIESDAAFARPLVAALSGRGLGVKLAADGQEGIDLARAEPPDAIVLSAELPRTSGYAICNRLKKDDALRAIPLVLTSGAGSEETFEQHRRLRTRAEEYLAKPFAPEALLAKLAPLLGVELPPAPAARSTAADAELVTLADVEEIESTLAALDEAARAAADGDLDLRAAAASAAAPPPPEPEPEPVAEPAPPAAAVALAEEEPPALAAAERAPEPLPDELQRLQDRVSELRVEAARAAEERERLAARAEAAERDRDEARARVAELEAQLEKHEARVVKAYERLKGDEAVKERTRRALAIALQLLDDGAAPGAEAERG